MSRIRTIKPDFWTSEQVISCSPLARLIFIGLWNFCDDNGVHPASYVRLKAEVFPVDNLSNDEVKKLVSELICNDLLREYSVEEKSYWIVTGWKKHQRIDKPTYRHPLPLSDVKKIGDYSANGSRELCDYSTSNHRIANEISTTEWKGMEGSGKEEKKCEVETSPVSSFGSFDVKEIFSHWQTVMNHPKAKIDKKRANKIVQSLKLGYSLAELKEAIDGCAKTPFNMGQNDKGQRYDDIELILRDASHIDRFIGNARQQPVNSNKADLMAGVI